MRLFIKSAHEKMPAIALLMLGLVVSALLIGQNTRVTPDNINPRQATTVVRPNLWGIVSNRLVLVEVVEGAQLKLENIAGLWRLKVDPAPAPTFNEVFVSFKPTADTGTFNPVRAGDTPIAGSIMVYRNGLLLNENDDYVVSGNTVNFATVIPLPTAGDIIKFRYRI